MQRQIIMNINAYDSDEDFWCDVKDLIKILTDNNYEILFRYEDCGNYVIEFSTRDRSLGEEIPIWVSPEDYENYFDEKCHAPAENNNNENNNYINGGCNGKI